jgi:hypothetical protein
MTNCGMYDTADLRIKAELTYCTCTGQNNQIDPKTNSQELSLHIARRFISISARIYTDICQRTHISAACYRDIFCATRLS